MLERFSAFLDGLTGLPYWQIAVLVILVVGTVAGGYLFLRPPSRPAGDFQPAHEEAAEAVRHELTVYVAGAVRHPGVVLLAEGDRVIDAIEAAGGPLPEADLEALNLAQAVQDGQKIAVPAEGAAVRDAGAPAGEEGRKTNINTAGREELEKLPGIGPTLAQRIIDYREDKGGFRNVDELKKVSGIGDKKFAELRDLVEI